MTKSSSVEARQYLSIDSLIQGLRERFEAIPDPRRAASTDHTLADCLMAAFAMFSLKDPSLLAFDQRRQDESLMNLYAGFASISPVHSVSPRCGGLDSTSFQKTQTPALTGLVTRNRSFKWKGAEATRQHPVRRVRIRLRPGFERNLCVNSRRVQKERVREFVADFSQVRTKP